MSHKLKTIGPDTLATASPDNGPGPRRKAREHLKTWVLEELWSIWRANPRVPSIESRRLWATSRNASPRLVDSWFLRRRTGAKKAGQPLLGGSYNLSLDQPAAPAHESSVTSIKPEQAEAIPDLSSDDTLAYPPDDNKNLKDQDTSSDTVFDEDTFTELRGTEMTAYNQQLCSKDCQFQLDLSSAADLNIADDHRDKDTPSSGNPFLSICNQGMGTVSDFTCILCSEVSDQDEVLFDFDTTSNSTGSPSMLYYPRRLDFSSDMLSELSAIPFLFRTPPAVLHDTITNYRSVDDWSMVEDELGRLVNDGNLDFSFLDDPWLASESMELFD